MQMKGKRVIPPCKLSSHGQNSLTWTFKPPFGAKIRLDIFSRAISVPRSKQFSKSKAIMFKDNHKNIFGLLCLLSFKYFSQHRIFSVN